jgi:TRAP-type C4-dicarboxylate transport system permease small subunit
MNRRGSLFDLVSVAIVLVFFGLTAVVGLLIVQNFNESFSATVDLSEDTQALMDANEDRLPSMFDNAFLTILVLSWVYLLVAGYLLNTNPVFLVVGVVFVLLSLVVVPILANLYADVSGTSTFSEATDGLPITNWIISNSLVVLIVMSITVLLSTYAGFRNQAPFGGGI